MPVQLHLAFGVRHGLQRSRLNHHGQPDVLALGETHVLGVCRALQVYVWQWLSEPGQPSRAVLTTTGFAGCSLAVVG